MKRNGRFTFVDGLTGLFTGDAGNGKDRTLCSSKEEDIKKEIEAAMAELKTETKILIIDSPDLLLAAADEGSVTSVRLSNMLLSLREVTTLLPPLPETFQTNIRFVARARNDLNPRGR